jgi:hypothetical protein
MDPGQSVQGSIRLFNETQGEQTYYASVQHFIPSGEEGQQSFLSGDEEYGLVKWINLDTDFVKLKAGDSKDFNWSISLPASAEPGGHYAAIFFSTVPPDEGGIGIGAKTGVLVLVNVNGEIKESASLDSFRTVGAADGTDAPSFYARKPVFFESRVTNGGSVHLQPTGKVHITNMFGQRVESIDANPLGSRVLPNSARRVRAIWGEETEPPLSFWQELKAEWKGLALGRYRAELEMVYGKQRQSLKGSVEFWVVPWRLSLGVLFLLFVLGVSIHWYNKFIVRRALGAAMKGK